MQEPALLQAEKHVQAQRLGEAVTILRRALEKQPGNVALNKRIAELLLDQGNFDQARYLLDRAIRLSPREPALYMYAADVEMRRKRYEAAEPLFARACQLDPSEVEFIRARCLALYLSNRFDEAMSLARRTYEQHPGESRSLGLYVTFCELTGDLNEIIRVLSYELEKAPNNVMVLQAILLPLARCHGVDPRVVFEYHSRLGRLLMKIIRKDDRPHANDPDPDRPLRIGYCSQDFRNRSAGHFIEPIITHHDKSQFKVFLYHNIMGEDELTDRLKKHAQAYIDVRKIDDRSLVDRFRDDKIDILVDLSGHTGMSRVLPFTVKPAPIQYTYMGYPNTTGIPAIDFRVVDWFTDPAGSEHLASEQLVRMDGSFLCYTPPTHAPEPAPAPSLSNKFVTFGSFNTLTKVSNHVLEVWARILLAVPDSRLFLKALSLAAPDTRERIWVFLESKGVTRERVDLTGETKGKDEHMGSYAKMDIALDPWPYNGTTTTVEANYMGVPVVTIAGNSHVSRVGVSLLNNIGLPDLIAKDEEEYIRIALRLGADEARRVDLRSKLRSMVTSSVLCDHAGFTRRLEAHYRQSWREWCEKKKANPAL